MTLIDRKRRRHRHIPKASVGRTCRIEPLERREVLSATNVFAQFTGILDPAVNNTVDFLEVSVSAEELSMAQEKAVLGFRLKAQHDAGLNPSVVTIRNQHGVPVAPLYARTNLPRSTESFVLAELASGDYTIEVTGAVGGRSQYTLNVFLPGDVNGDHRVDATDLEAIRAAYGARVGSGGGGGRRGLEPVQCECGRQSRRPDFRPRLRHRPAQRCIRRESPSFAANGSGNRSECQRARCPPTGRAGHGVGGGPASRVPAVVPQAGYNPNAPMRFYESTNGFVQALPMTAQGHSAVFRAGTDDPNYVFDWIYREAAYNNSMFAYKVDDAIGSLDTGQAHGTVNPNTLTEDDQAQAAAYRDAALANLVTIFEPGERANMTQGHLLKQPIIPPAWEYYSIVVRQNGDSYYWFPFEHVNEDNYAHFQAVTYAADHQEPWYGQLDIDAKSEPSVVAFKVEDLSPSLPNPYGYINDADFDDVVFQALAVDVEVSLAQQNVNPLVLLEQSLAAGDVWAEATYVQTESIVLEVSLPSSIQSGQYVVVLTADTGLSIWSDAERTWPISPGIPIAIDGAHYYNVFFVDAGAETGHYEVTAQVHWIDPFTQQPSQVGKDSQTAIFHRIIDEGGRFFIEKAPEWAETRTVDKLTSLMDSTLKPTVVHEVQAYIGKLDPDDPHYDTTVANVNKVISETYNMVRDNVAAHIGQIAFDKTQGLLKMVLPKPEPGAPVARPIFEAMSNIFDDPHASLDEPSLQVNVTFEDLGAMLGQQVFWDALEAAASGDTSLAEHYLNTFPNYANSASVTVNLKTGDDKIVPLAVGVAQFDYVPGQHKWYETQQLRHNRYFMQMGLAGQDWGFLHFDKDIRFEFQPMSRDTGKPTYWLEGEITW